MEDWNVIKEEVRSRNNIVDVVSGYVALRKKGSKYWACCPFHNEHTPSFSVDGNKQMFHCFGCGEGGDVFAFLMKYENLTFPEALKILADRAGIALPEREGGAEERRRADRRTRLLEVNKEAATFFYVNLRGKHGEKGMQYLKGRGLTDETLQSFGLGYAGVNGREVVEYLRGKGFSDEEIRESGVASFSEKNGLSSLFWNRVMFPIMDANKRVIGFGGRVMGDAKPKYLNTAETPIFDKRRNLYGFVFARRSRAGSFILCEGYMDVIALHQAGFSQAVASLGTAFTEEQAALLKRYTSKVLLAYDSDGAGVKAALRAIGILRDAGLSGRVINMRPYKDPDEFIQNLGKEAFQERLDAAENAFFFEVRMLAEGVDESDPEARTQFHREIARMLCRFREDAERENYLQAICEKYEIGAENLRKLVRSYAASGIGTPQGAYRAGASWGAGDGSAGEGPAGGGMEPAGGIARPRSRSREQRKADGIRNAEALLLTWLSDDPKVYRSYGKYLSPEDLTEGIPRKTAKILLGQLAAGEVNAPAIPDHFEDEEEKREAAGLLQERLPETENEKERERTLRGILISVKKNAYDTWAAEGGTSMETLQESLRRKKELEELSRIMSG